MNFSSFYRPGCNCDSCTDERAAAAKTFKVGDRVIFSGKGAVVDVIPEGTRGLITEVDHASSWPYRVLVDLESIHDLNHYDRGVLVDDKEILHDPAF